MELSSYSYHVQGAPSFAIGQLNVSRASKATISLRKAYSINTVHDLQHRQAIALHASDVTQSLGFCSKASPSRCLELCCWRSKFRCLFDRAPQY